MRTLYEALTRHAEKQAPSLIKHLRKAQIFDWDDLTKLKLEDFVDEMSEEVAVSSAHTYVAVLKSVIGRYEEDIDIPCKDFREALRCKNDKPMKTYLDLTELKQLEAVPCNSKIEEFVKDSFLIGAFTGMRISDTLNISAENIDNGYISYVSIKTAIQATIPCKVGIEERIDRVRASGMEVPLMTYNRTIRRLCERAKINKSVKVRKGGKEKVGEKWQFVSSHTARISFATNLADLNVPLLTIATLCGHTNTQMTERYIVSKKVELSSRAMKLFQ